MNASKVVEFLSGYVEFLQRVYIGDNRRPQTLEEFVFHNGKVFTKKKEADEYGKMKECYKNAFLLMLRKPSLYYCEGFALCEKLPLPVLHAWCVDKEGRVYDPTWKDGTEYYGVVFNRKFAEKRILKTRTCIIDDWKNRWPLLTGKEKKEWRVDGAVAERLSLVDREYKRNFKREVTLYPARPQLLG